LSWPAITIRICGSVIRTFALANRSTRSATLVRLRDLREWSISSTMTFTFAGVIRLRHGFPLVRARRFF